MRQRAQRSCATGGLTAGYDCREGRYLQTIRRVRQQWPEGPVTGPKTWGDLQAFANEQSFQRLSLGDLLATQAENTSTSKPGCCVVALAQSLLAPSQLGADQVPRRPAHQYGPPTEWVPVSA